MSGMPNAGRRPRLNVAYGSWDLIWSHVHRVLVVNLGLAAANLPLLVALQATHQPWGHPIAFLLLSLGIGPSLAAAFGYLGRAENDERAPTADYFRAYRRLFARAVAMWAPFALLAGTAAADAVLLRETAPVLALVPALVVIALLAGNSGVVAMVHVATDDSVRVGGRSCLAALYTVTRRWMLGLMNLGLLAVAVLLVNQDPLLGLAVLPGCVLFVVRRNAGAMLAAALPGTR
ncbi:hypothetical protein AB0M87_16210 [Streptomyces sp. NPDC051320]|uniref:hypothetical protein n=1 Tax=Streptomyces sp. NPDC051320 TaxID=3154644 RepID=UPI003428FD32